MLYRCGFIPVDSLGVNTAPTALESLGETFKPGNFALYHSIFSQCEVIVAVNKKIDLIRPKCVFFRCCRGHGR